MPPGGGGSDPAPAGASYHAGPHQVGFANLFHGGGFFADGNGEGGYPDRAAAMAFDEGGEDGTVEPVEGRQWATATKRLVAVRAHRTRSETDRSAMTCQSAMS